jgi:nucleoside-diphosphate-sugar epimerase
MKKNKVLVTGGSGYFGSILIKKLISKNFDVHSLDINKPENINKYIFHNVDITDKKKIENFFLNYKFDYIFHNVAQVPLAKKKSLFNKVNINGTYNICKFAKKNKVKHLIYTSSSAVYGVPNNNPVTELSVPKPAEAYGVAKLEGEKICKSFSGDKFKITIIRPRTIMGHGRLGIFSILFDWIDNNKKIPLFNNGKNLYQFIHAEDLADACISSIKQNNNFEIFNIGSNDLFTMKEILQNLVIATNSKSKFYSLPLFPTENILNILSTTGLIPLSKYHTLMYGRSLYFDISKAKKKLDFKPKFSTSEMFRESFNNYIDNKNKSKDIKNLSHHQKKTPQLLLKIIKFFS